MAEVTYEAGDRVRIFIDSPNADGSVAFGKVRVVQDTPGKLIGVELDQFTERAHALDGLVEERSDEVRQVTFGKGWWTRPENIQKV